MCIGSSFTVSRKQPTFLTKVNSGKFCYVRRLVADNAPHEQCKERPKLMLHGDCKNILDFKPSGNSLFTCCKIKKNVF
jgi:hypothetical protein